MPELPEVQTIVNDLQPLVGQSLIDFYTNFEKAIKGDSLSDFRKKIIKTSIVSIERIAKNIAILLANGYVIIIHLKMTGQLIANRDLTRSARSYLKKRQLKHLHHAFAFEKGILEFHDIRKFATLELLNENQWEEKMARQAMDPAKKNFLFKTFLTVLQSNKMKKIKPTLMDGNIVAGIGNIYANEILFAAGVLPDRPIYSLSIQELKKIFTATIGIIAKAINLRGTSVSDYRDGQGKRGSFQNHLKTYKKHGENCKRCGTIILRSMIAQRSSFYCPHCQK